MSIRDSLKIDEATLLSILVESSGLIVIVLDSQFKIEYANKAAFDLLGLSNNEIIGKNWVDCFIPNSYKGVIKRAINKRKSEVKGIIESTTCPIIDSIKAFQWVDWHIVKHVYNSNNIKIILSGENVTARKQAESALAESEEKYRSVVEGVKDIIMILSNNKEIISLNIAFTAITGWDLYYGLTHKITHFFYSDDQNIISQKLAEIKNGASSSEFESKFKCKNGEFVFLEFTITPFLQGGSFSGFLGVARDITERKKAEEQIQNDLKEKEVLLKEVHHRVKNNLQVISSLLTLQSRLIEDPQVQNIFNNSKHRVLAIARIHEALYNSEDFSKINFSEYVESLIKNLIISYGIDITNIKYYLNIDQLYIDMNKAVPLGLIINELVTNSLKHAFPNGRSGMFRVELLRNNEKGIILIVEDNGVGLSEKIDLQNTKSLGFELVNVLILQLDAKISFHTKSGVRYKILIPI